MQAKTAGIFAGGALEEEAPQQLEVVSGENGAEQTVPNQGTGTEEKKAKAPKDPFLNAKYVKVAMRLAYNGQKYNGFETCEDKHQTHTLAVEDKLFDALEKVTLIRDRKTIEKECNYAKSGRTDAGVSASYNVISLKVRQVCGRKRA